MTTALPPEGEDFADGIFDANSYEAPMPPTKEFLPWHRPRKQFVRDKQWRDQIAKLLDDSPRSDGTLKYLGLPGADLLDLRYFHSNICAARGLGLKFLGFNTALAHEDTQIALNISLDEVRRLDGVDQLSDVIGDDFVRVANPKSIAWQRTLDQAPFDVVNLDLCNGFALHDVGFGDSHYNAMTQLLGLQARQKLPWLLLLTTLAGPEHVNAAVLEKLVRRYIDNLAGCDGFRDASIEKFQIGDEEQVLASVATEAGLLPVFLCALGKWLTGIAHSQNPPTKVEVKSVIGYRVHGDSNVEDLVSIAIRFTPTYQAATDPLGLAGDSHDQLDECATAIRILNRVAARKNADNLLRDNLELNREMIDSTATLLEEARYDVDAYRVWASEPQLG